MSGSELAPCSVVMSLIRVTPLSSAAGCPPARSTSAAMRPKHVTRMSKHLVEQPQQETGRQAVFDQPLPKILDAHLADRSGRDDVRGVDVDHADDAGDDDDLPIAVDADFLHAFDD